MVMFLKVKRKLKSVIGPLIGVGLIVYFIYHFIHGDRGLLSWIKLQEKIQESEITLQSFQTQKVQLEHQVNLLKPDSLDLDMLDQRVREILSFVRPDEVVIKQSDLFPPK